jgi:hypothetical protein
MPCIVHDTVNRWGAPPPPVWFRRADRAQQDLELALTRWLGADARCWQVRVAGSVLNGTATICSSDVDLHLVRCDRYSYELPPGLRRDAFNAAIGCPVACGFPEHRSRVEAACKAEYGALASDRPKALQITGDSDRLDADIIVGLEHRRFTCVHHHIKGVELRSRGDDQTRVICFPERRRARIEAHDGACGNRYRPIVRILKCVRRCFRDCDDPQLRKIADEIPSCLLEAILACVPPHLYWESSACHFPVLERVLPAAIDLLADPQKSAHLQDLDGLDALFAPTKTWSRDQLLQFLFVAHFRLQDHNIPLAA